MLNKKDLILLTTLIVMVPLSYNLFDIELARFFFKYINSNFTYVMGDFTKIGKPEIFLAISAIISAYFYRSKNRYLKKALFVMVSIYSSYLVTAIIKVTLARARPVEYFNNSEFGFTFLKYAHDYNSMPSGHTTIVTATVLSLMVILDKSYHKYLLLFMFLISFSRLIVLDHYLSDIFTSWLIAYIVVKVIQVILKNKKILLD